VTNTFAAINLTNTWTAPQIFSGITSPQTNNTLYVDGTTYNGSPDLGVTLNAMYAALPSTGGRLVVPTGNFTMSTAFTATTAGKPATVECAPGGETTITWAGSTSASAFTFDSRNGSNTHPVGLGLKDCFVTTSGSNTGSAVEFGNTNSGEGGVVEEDTLIGFGNGVLIDGGGNTSWNIFVTEASIINAGNSCINVGPGTGGAENTHIAGGVCIGSANGISITGSSNSSDVTASDWSCDGPTSGTCINMNGAPGATVTLLGPHFENPGGGTTNYASVQSGNLLMWGGVAGDDISTGSQANSWFSISDTASAGEISALGMVFSSVGRVTTAPLFTASGLGRLVTAVNLVVPSNFTGGVYPAAAYTAGVVINYSNLGARMEVTAADVITQAVETTPTTVAALPAAATGNKGWWKTVSNSTTVSAEGQTCVDAGGGGVAAAAFSTGLLWKCF
jgi:hypothetical protein